MWPIKIDLWQTLNKSTEEVQKWRTRAECSKTALIRDPNNGPFSESIKHI